MSRGREPLDLPPDARRRREAVEEELRFHIEEHAAELMKQGVSCEAALERAEAAFRDLGRTRAELERMDARRAQRESLLEMIGEVWTDTRRAVRGLARRPGLALLAVCTLGLGIGANATMYGLVKRLLLSAPPHIEDAERLALLRFDEAQQQAGRITWVGTSYPSFLALRDARGFERVAAYTASAATMVEGGVADPVDLLAVSEEYFDVLGVRAALGALPHTGQDAEADWAMLGHGLWLERFQGSRDVLGRELRLGDASFRIVGVLPRGFTGVDLAPHDIWIPITAPLPGTAADWTTNEGLRSVFVAARLAAVPRADAERLATATYRAARSGLPVADSTARVILRSAIPGRGEDGSPSTPEAKVTVWLQATAILVLLIALFNVQNLFLLRAMERKRETAIARALGITRLRLVRMLGLEYAVVALAGALLSLVLVRVGAPALWLLVLPAGTDIGVLTRDVMGLAVTVAAGVAVVLTIITALMQARIDVAATLRDGGRGSTAGGSRVRDTLVVAQVAMTFVLAVGAGLFVRSMMKIGTIDWGFETERVAAVHLSPSRLGLDAAAAGAFAERAAERLRALPGIEEAAFGLSVPLRPSLGQPVRLPGQETLPGVGQGGLGYPTFFVVSPEYFDVMGIAVLRGRGFTSADHAASTPVVLVDATMARTFWPDGDALGACIHFGADPAPCTTVVGVVEDTRRVLTDQPHSLRYYLPIAQNTLTWGERYVFVRAAGAAPLDVSAVRSSLSALHLQAGAAEIVMLHELREPYVRPWRLGSTVFLVFGVLSQIVAALGLYGVLAFGVAQRRRELGIRVALGASRTEVTRLVVGGALRRVFVAIGCGLVVALLAGRLIEGLLFETPQTDPLVYVVVAGLAIATALGASAIPAMRALRVDPATSLRVD